MDGRYFGRLIGLRKEAGSCLTLPRSGHLDQMLDGIEEQLIPGSTGGEERPIHGVESLKWIHSWRNLRPYSRLD